MSEYCNNTKYMTVSEVVKFIRAKRLISLEQLGNMFGVTKSAAWQWENGNIEPRRKIKESL